MNLYFTYESRDTLKYLRLFITVKITSKLNVEHSVNFGLKLKKISRCRGNKEFGHFTLLFCKGRQRNVPRVITHLHSHSLLRSLLTAVKETSTAVVGFLNSLLLYKAKYSHCITVRVYRPRLTVYS